MVTEEMGANKAKPGASEEEDKPKENEGVEENLNPD